MMKFRQATYDKILKNFAAVCQMTQLGASVRPRRSKPPARKMVRGDVAPAKAPAQRRAAAPKSAGRKKPAAPKAKVKTPSKRARAPSTKKRAAPRRRVVRKPKAQPRSDFVIVDDNLRFDPQKVDAERRAYLEEARSQDVTD